LSTTVWIVLILAIAVVILRLAPILLKFAMFRFAVKSGLKEIGKVALSKQPDQIHLNRTSDTWKNADAARKLTSPLMQRGFVEAGAFRISEMPDILVAFLINEEKNIYACVYEHPKVGNWMELVTRYQDGGGATFTMQPDRGVTHRPQDVVVHCQEASPDALLDRALRERSSRPMIALDAGGLATRFANAWAEQVAWKKKEGPSADEVARVIISKGAKAGT
jgi:hypothetical protein